MLSSLTNYAKIISISMLNKDACVCLPLSECRYLKSEMHSRLHTARFAVILETYLKGCGESLLVGDETKQKSSVLL